QPHALLPAEARVAPARVRLHPELPRSRRRTTRRPDPRAARPHGAERGPARREALDGGADQAPADPLLRPPRGALHAAVREGARTPPAALHRGVSVGAFSPRALARRESAARVHRWPGRRDALFGERLRIPDGEVPRGLPLP